ncbi:MAG TPA: M20/M25/M40 family metallo-hydrolase [Pyrinomonadaceae bacterium]|nr:M20/M25/M40 family metallo-hydrolase [Acidobacteriota bacterium]HQZ97722.1 M20/M25/M40 family metallo-hydrolase [Pyrinomonadaceae bacterium]
MTRRHLSLILVFVMWVAAPAALAQKSAKPAAKPSTPSFGNVDGISAKQLREYLTFIASDELEGRDTPSRGLDIAAMFIAQHLSSWGIKPAGDNGSYFQKIPLRLNKIDTDKTRLEINGQSYTYGKDFLASQIGANIAGAPLVFVGNGWVIKSKNIDPYAGLDIKDKVVVVVNTLPKGITFNDLKGPAGGDWFSPPLYAQTNGAKAVIAFSSFGNLANWEGVKWNQSEKGQVEFGKPQTQITIPTFTVTPRVIGAMFAGEKASGGSLFTRSITGDAMDSFDLKAAKKLNATVAVKTENIHTQNVVGILEGSDPVLKNEYVAIGAHYDHVGMNPFAAGDDKIWNGADDDGSGTVAVLSIAEAFAKGKERPKRSMLFIWHAGEEKGLWGSEYFANNPTVPITSIITELNIDMIGRYQNPGDENHPQNKNLPKQGEVFTIGSRMMSTELGDLSDSVNKTFLNLAFNTKYDDPKDPEQFFYRSDHFNYAKKGIPIIFYMDGSHADYHQPSDSVEKINFESMEKVTKTIMATGWTLANTAKRPTVDKPLPASVLAGN